MEQTEQLKASALMLDMGVAVPVRPFKFLYSKRKPRRVIMRTSGLANLMRIANLYLRMGVTYNEMKEYTFEQNMQFIAEHGVTISRIVAYTLVRSKFLGRLLNRPLPGGFVGASTPCSCKKPCFSCLPCSTRSLFRLLSARWKW